MNPKDLIGAKKVSLHLLPTGGLIHEALAMENGAAKYGPFNWREKGKAVHAMVYIAACQRHLMAWLDGEEIANDSGIHHLGHAKACLGILLDAMECDNLVDDRPTPGPTPKLLLKFDKSRPRENPDLTDVIIPMVYGSPASQLTKLGDESEE